MIKKAHLVDYEITVKVTCTCPNCGNEVKLEFSGNPYREIAEDPPDEVCPHCHEFFTVSFYEDDEN
jgi:Zn finger protein HypA/HybF involved in hydrogenase expression